MEVVAANVGELDRQGNKESVLREFVRFSWGVSRGVTQAAETEGRQLVEKMVQIGRVTPEQGTRLLSTLTWKMAKSRETFEVKVDSSVRRTIEKLQSVTRQEATKLSGRVTELEKRLEKLVTKTGK